MCAPPSPSAYVIRAVNNATASSNKIHDDEIARSFGFSGGLVPGVTVYAYMGRPVLETLGPEWIEHGRLSARFLKPVYDGEEITVGLRPIEDSAFAVTVLNLEGVLCAEGTAAIEKASVAPLASDYGTSPAPQDPLPAADLFRSPGALGSVEAVFHRESEDEFLRRIGETPLREPVAHPGWLILLANRILTANARLGPWIHASSDVQNFSAVRDGERIQARGRVVDGFERNGHRFVKLDVLLVAGDERPATKIRHVAIWEPRKISS